MCKMIVYCSNQEDCGVAGLDEQSNTTGLRRATLKDVAERAGVSINTASVVLNPRRNQVVVHPDTRARVEAAARELRYRRNLAASRLAGGAANTFCILTDRMTNYFNSVILDAFEAEATRHGFQCMLSLTQPADPQKLDYLQALGVQGVDGFVLGPVWKAPAVRQILPGILHEDVAVVFVDYRPEGHPGPLVSCDHRAGGVALARHLADQGHQRMLYLREAAQEGVGSVDARIAGAAEVVNALPQGRLSIATGATRQPDDLTAAVWDLLHAPEAPTAVLCANDHVALGLIAGLNRRGMNALGTLAVTGFDDVNTYLPQLLEFPSDLPFPWEIPLTTYRQPFEAIGTRAAELLVTIARGERQPPFAELLLPGELIPRASTAHRV